MFGFFGCGGARYRVDYCGMKSAFPGAKDAYRAGELVTLDFPYIATDTDYRFYLDGEPLNTDYEHKRGFILRFTMPAHDVVLTVESRNSMLSPDAQAAP